MISVGFLSPGDKPLVWRGPMLHSIVKQFLGQVEWGQLDYLVVDLPPGTGDVVISLVQTVPLTGAVVVTTPSDVVVAGRAQSYRDVQAGEGRHYRHRGEHELLCLPALPCKRSTSSPRAAAQRTAQQFGVPFLGSIELDPDIRKGGDSGQPIVLEGDQSPHAKSLFAFTQRVIERTKELQEADSGSVIEIQ